MRRRPPTRKLSNANLTTLSFSIALYQIAFLQNDAAGMAQQVAMVGGKPGVEDGLLGMEADTAAYSGRLKDAREFSRRAMDSAERHRRKGNRRNLLCRCPALGKPCSATQTKRGGASLCVGALDGPRCAVLCARSRLAYARDDESASAGRRFGQEVSGRHNRAVQLPADPPRKACAQPRKCSGGH